MKFIVFVSLVVGKRFDTLYAFGDSISDNGNLYRLKDKLIPATQLYYNGRFSNGPVWVEYLANTLKANLVDMAYASATTDNDVYRASLSTDASPVPGCVQQVNIFAQSIDIHHFEPEDSLVSIVFLGNDFFLPNSTTEGYVTNIKQCLDNLISKTNATNILVATTNAPEIYPAVRTLPTSLSNSIDIKFQESPFLMRQMLQQIRAKFPTTNLYELDMAHILRSIANQTTSNKACLQKPTIDSPLVICPNPDSQMFWDDLHPTTKAHKDIATAAQLTLI